MTARDWEHRRSALTHTLLQNRICTRLVQIADRGVLSAGDRSLLGTWLDRVPEYQLLLARAPQVLSGAWRLSQSPFDRLSDPDRSALTERVLEAWAHRRAASEALALVTQSLDESRGAITALLRCPCTRDRKSTGARALRACSTLASSLSALSEAGLRGLVS